MLIMNYVDHQLHQSSTKYMINYVHHQHSQPTKIMIPL